MPTQNPIQKILVADDDLELAKTISTHLKWEGYHVIHAFDGFQAQLMISAARKNSMPIDVVITDYLMPHTDGLELVDWIQENHREISIIIISGFLNKEGLQQKLRPEKDFYHVKPITPSDLEKLLVRIALKRQTPEVISPRETANIFPTGD